MPCLYLGPGNESLENDAVTSIFTSNFVFVHTSKSTQQEKAKSVLLRYMFRNEPYRLRTSRPRFHAAEKPLCIVCITYLIPLGIDVSLKTFEMYCR